jgi:hypothetical protein
VDGHARAAADIDPNAFTHTNGYINAGTDADRDTEANENAQTTSTVDCYTGVSTVTDAHLNPRIWTDLNTNTNTDIRNADINTHTIANRNTNTTAGIDGVPRRRGLRRRHDWRSWWTGDRCHEPE